MIAQVRHRPDRPDRPGRGVRVGVPARPLPARQPGPAPADPAAPAAAPRQGLRPPVQPVAALGPPGRAAPLRPDPRRAPAVVPDRRTAPALGVPGPGPLPARPAGPAGGAPAGHGARPAPIRPRSWPMSSCATPARSSPPPPRPTSTHLTAAVRAQHGRVHVFNPQHIGGVGLHLLLGPGRGMRGPGHRDPPRRRVRVRRVPEGRRGRHVLVRQGLGLPARLLLRRRPGPLRPARRRGLGGRRRPGRPGADPARRRRPPVGPHPGRTPLRSPQDRRHRADGHVQIPGLHGRPGPGRQRAARPRRRVRHPRLPRRHRHRVPDRRGRLRRGPGRPAVRRDGHRDPLGRRPARPGVAVRPAGSAAADGPGRGDPDLPGPAAVLAVGLRRQGHPGRAPSCTARPSWPTAGAITDGRSCSTPPR